MGSGVGSNAACRLHFVATCNPRATGVSLSQYVYLDFLNVDRSLGLNITRSCGGYSKGGKIVLVTCGQSFHLCNDQSQGRILPSFDWNISPYECNLNVVYPTTEQTTQKFN